MPATPITAVIVGAGHRSLLYAFHAKDHPDELKIVGVADPSEHRRAVAVAAHDPSPEQCFENAAELAAKPRQADVIINGTMDHLHVPTSLPLLAAGYDLLLEKPFATNKEEMWQLVKAARKHKRKVMICHVLRYSPFYNAVRRKVVAGAIGRIQNIQTVEHVSFHHMAAAFIRGKWGRSETCHSEMLMSKCCHDLDLIMWMKSGVKPVAVASFGGLTHFKADQAPAGAGKRCLADCAIEKECPYSARKHYLDRDWWKYYAWEDLERVSDPTPEQKENHLRDNSPFGRCVWHCDNTVVDHQSVMIEFADGATATHNLVGGVARPLRSIHLLGTEGEIQGEFESGRFVVRRPDAAAESGMVEEVVDLNVTGDLHGMTGGHGGGDLRLVADFLRLVRGEEPSIATTSLADSVSGHLTGFRAEQARKERRVVEIGGGE